MFTAALFLMMKDRLASDFSPAALEARRGWNQVIDCREVRWLIINFFNLTVRRM
jgi:hypothetical protein